MAKLTEVDLTRHDCHPKLSLDCNRIGDPGAESLSQALPKARGLTKLSLSTNLIGDSGVTALGGALQHTQRLKELVLSCNDIGDAGACSLGEALPHSHLTKLFLDGNLLTDVGACGITEGLRHTPTLTQLTLDNDAVSPDVLRRCEATLAVPSMQRERAADEYRRRHQERAALLASLRSLSFPVDAIPSVLSIEDVRRILAGVECVAREAKSRATGDSKDRSELSQCQHQLEAALAAKDSALSMVSEVRKERDTALSRFQECQDSLVKAQSRLLSLNNALKDTKKRLEEEQRQHAVTRQTGETVKTGRRRTRRQSRPHVESDQGTAALESIRESLRQCQRDSQAKDEDISRLRASMSQSDTRHKHQVDDMQLQIESLSETVAELRKNQVGSEGGHTEGAHPTPSAPSTVAPSQLLGTPLTVTPTISNKVTSVARPLDMTNANYLVKTFDLIAEFAAGVVAAYMESSDDTFPLEGPPIMDKKGKKVGVLWHKKTPFPADSHNPNDTLHSLHEPEYVRRNPSFDMAKFLYLHKGLKAFVQKHSSRSQDLFNALSSARVLRNKLFHGAANMVASQAEVNEHQTVSKIMKNMQKALTLMKGTSDPTLAAHIKRGQTRLDCLSATFEQSLVVRRLAEDYNRIADESETVGLSLSVLDTVSAHLRGPHPDRHHLGRLVLTSLGAQVPSSLRVNGMEDKLRSLKNRTRDPVTAAILSMIEARPYTRHEFYGCVLGLATTVCRPKQKTRYQKLLGEVTRVVLDGMQGDTAQYEREFRQCVRARRDFHLDLLERRDSDPRGAGLEVFGRSVGIEMGD
ncbi:hypothetical protein KIPB_001391 [Kipferlia bialata]|uniref:Uncharacterized protein n=1 Tax=Kipferlia bialata TaxID=797122 RepID=A0A9K3CNV0_9EUKA|nr:hypothetical protein KIPB_001391 [Kipferlia bialata]|eukprot:g1391.t1